MFRACIVEDDSRRVNWFLKHFKFIDIDIISDMSEVNKWNGPYSLYFLDHDLGNRIFIKSEDPNSGYSFIKWLILHYPEELSKEFIIHSLNPIGSENMKKLLIDNSAKKVSTLPFNVLMDFWFKNDLVINDIMFKDVRDL
jgi:hypothetical protein